MTQTVAPRVPAADTLSARLRTLTAEAHEAAETADFVVDLMRGALDIDAYYHLLEQYSYIYNALEVTAGKMRENEAACDLLSVELNRSESIAADLEALGKRITAEPVGMLASTRDYVEQILATEHDAVRYLAHHYVRYLGDLSGGQVMRVWLTRHYDLTDNETSFFHFDEIPKPVPFKNAYRARIDALELDDAQAKLLIDEANSAFTANQEIFEELNEVTRSRIDIVPAESAPKPTRRR
jgi:heme oxygenase